MEQEEAKIRMENGGLFGRKAMQDSVGKSQESYIFHCHYIECLSRQDRTNKNQLKSSHIRTQALQRLR